MKTDMYSRRFARTLAFAILALSCVAVRTADAEVIDWGFDTFGATSIDSNGTAFNISPDSYTFYLGAFNELGSFVPDRSNIGSWAANWRTFDDTPYNEGTNFFHDNVPFVPADNANFAAGTQAFIWGTNGGSIGSGDEWILLTSASWLFPTGTPTGTTTSYFLLTQGGTDTGVTAIVGAIDNTYSGSESGISGDYTASNFDLQTEAVPEPASALFFSISAIWFLFRRPRRATS